MLTGECLQYLIIVPLAVAERGYSAVDPTTHLSLVTRYITAATGKFRQACQQLKIDSHMHSSVLSVMV